MANGQKKATVVTILNALLGGAVVGNLIPLKIAEVLQAVIAAVGNSGL